MNTESEDETDIGPYGLGYRKKIGERLIRFCEGKQLENNQHILKKNSSRWTWCAP